MSGFYLTLLAVVLAGIGARDQVLIAHLSRAQGQRPLVLLIAIVCAAATAAFAAWAAMTVAPLLNVRAQRFFMAMALVLAGLESIVIRPRGPMREPTLSLIALAFTLIAFQAIDAARFLIFAMAIEDNPWLTGAAGAIGGAVLVTAGWMASELFTDPRLRLLRRVIGLVLLLIGLFIAAPIVTGR